MMERYDWKMSIVQREQQQQTPGATTNTKQSRWLFLLGVALISHWMLLSVVHEDQHFRAAMTESTKTSGATTAVAFQSTILRPTTQLSEKSNFPVNRHRTASSANHTAAISANLATAANIVVSSASCHDTRTNIVVAPIGEYFRNWLVETNITKDECRQDTAVYTAAFDHETLQQFHNAMQIRQNYSNYQLEAMGRCFFLFTSHDVRDELLGSTNTTDSSESIQSSMMVGHFWVIPMPSYLLPYAAATTTITATQNNDNYIKYLGTSLLFETVTATTLIWQDADTFFSDQYMYQLPQDYADIVPATNDDAAACLTGIGLPRNHLQGRTFISTYSQHCELWKDETERQQCRSYLQQVGSSNQQAIISAQLLLWRNSNDACSRFNTKVQCAMLEEMESNHHPERVPGDDAFVLPYIISTLDLLQYHKGKSVWATPDFNPQLNEVELYPTQSNRGYRKKDHVGPLVRVVRSNCHWRTGGARLGQNCKYWGDATRNALPAIPFDSMMQNSSNNSTYSSLDFRTCTSPEAQVAFPLKGEVQSIFGNNHTCGLKAGTPISKYLEEIRNKVMPPFLQECQDLAVFGVALGHTFVKNLRETLSQRNETSPSYSERIIQQHGKCFFMFVSQEDMPRGLGRPLLQGHLWFLPIPKSVFPYRNGRRNAKLLKYMGHLVFPGVRNVIWQDAKLVSDFQHQQPHDYSALIQQNDTCVTTFGLPIHGNTMGQHHPAVLRGDVRPPDKFQAHCNTIVRAIQRRPNVTDSIDSVAQQCMAYVNHVQQEEETSSSSFATGMLDDGMVDTAFMIWNHQTKNCRTFSNSFRCSLLHQIHCHSDRDQVPFPFVLNEMKLQGYYHDDSESGKMTDGDGGTLKLVDDDWNPRYQDLDLKSVGLGSNTSAASSSTTRVRILRSNCHWYATAIGQGCDYWK